MMPYLNPLRLDIDPVPSSPLPISLDLIKLHCAVDSTDQDELLTRYLFAAIEEFEGSTHRSLFVRAHRWVLQDFSRQPYQRIWLPRGKTVSVDSIAYVNGGVTTTLRGPTSNPVGTDWQEDLRGNDGGMLLPPLGQSWPSVQYDVPAPVTITFTAGFAELPDDALNALLFYIRSSLDDFRIDDPWKGLGTFRALVSSFGLSRVY